MCLQTERDRRKITNRAITKARTALYRHAKKYEMNPQGFSSTYGWEVTQMAKDINHAYSVPCPHCQTPYSEQGNGLRDLSLDIINPLELPYYTNVRYCCSTCNSVKGQRGAEGFGLHLVMVKKRNEYLQAQPGTILKPQYVLNLGGKT